MGRLAKRLWAAVLKHPLRWFAFQRVKRCPLEFVHFIPVLRGCFHAARYMVHRAKDRATAPVGAAKPNARIIDNGYLDLIRGEARKNPLKARYRLSREVDDETHRDRFWPPRFPGEIGFVGRRALTRQRQRSRWFSGLYGQ